MAILKSNAVIASGNHVTWSDSYSMGIKIIDEQHKDLLDFVNELYAHATGNEEEELAWFKEVIQQAVQYIKEHFATEEKYMKLTMFHGYAEHKKTHDEFTLIVENSVKDFQEGKGLDLEKFAYFLKDWVLTHLAIMDRQYSNYYWRIATYKADGNLTVTAADVA